MKLKLTHKKIYNKKIILTSSKNIEIKSVIRETTLLNFKLDKNSVNKVCELVFPQIID